MAKVSKNAKTNRKSLVNMFNGQKVKPVKLLRNPLGMMCGDAKVPAGGIQAVQLDNGSLLMNGEKVVFWDEIKHLIVKQ